MSRILFMNADMTVKSHQVITEGVGGFTGLIDADYFGYGVDNIGDFNGDGVTDIVVSAWGDDDQGTDDGALWLLYLNTDGTVKGFDKITESDLSFDSSDDDRFGTRVINIGDLDGDGVTDLAAGEWLSDRYTTDAGAVYIMFMNADGTVKYSTDITPDEVPGHTPTTSEYFGHSLDLVGDVNGDGVQDLVVGGYGGGEDVSIVFLNRDGTVKGGYVVNDSNISAAIGLQDFGWSVAGVGDWNKDGIPDIAVGANLDDDEGTDRGAVYIIYLDRDAPQTLYVKLSDNKGELNANLEDSDNFGGGVASLGDWDGDGIQDLVVGAI